MGTSRHDFNRPIWHAYWPRLHFYDIGAPGTIKRYHMQIYNINKDIDHDFVKKSDIFKMLTITLWIISLGFTLEYLWISYLPRAGDEKWWVWRLFDLNEENNPPAIYSTLLWVGAAALALRLAVIDRGKGAISNRIYWLAIAGVSLFLGADEGFVIHERIGEQIEACLPHLPVYDWVIYGGVVMAVVGFSLLGFVLRLPRRTCGLILLSAAIFVFGAVIMESLGAMVEKGVITNFPPGIDWPRETAIEEFCEMAGVILFIQALEGHARQLLAAISRPHETGEG